MRIGSLLACLTALCCATPAAAIFIRPELERVPVARLIENLETALKKEPKDAKVKLNLARAHAMAYASKSDTVELNKKAKDTDGPWFGYTPPFVPFNKVQKTDDPEKQKAAQAHLKKALELYEELAKDDPKNLVARIGHAWLLEQSGKKDEAIKAYRKLIDEAWEKDKDLQALGISGNTITIEAGGYLVALLDKEKDKEEIAAINEKIAKLRKLPRPVTPVAVPLKDGLAARDVEDPSARVTFDADGSGLPRQWTWITPDAGWLVHDPLNTGRVDSALQLFGGVTFWMFWENGYRALSALDDNADGELRGDELKGLAIWHDRNHDGVCRKGEVKPLADHGIVAVSCRFEIDASHPDRIAYSPKGVTLKNGTTRPTFDLILKSRD